MKKSSIISFACLLSTSFMSISCSQEFYQVYTMESKDMKMQDNSILFENDDCQVSYNLWSNGGIISFAFINKTDRDIFLNMNESFLVVNGQARNYFEDKTYTYGAASSLSFGYGESLGVSLGGKTGAWANKLYTVSSDVAGSLVAKTTLANTVSIKEQPVVCIPAHSYKSFSKFCLSPIIYQKCDKKVDYPTRKESIMKYSFDNSPIKMNNRLTYGFSNNNMDKHIDNIMWLGEITNYPRKDAIENGSVKGCYEEFSKKVSYFKIGTPTQFYQIYRPKTGSF